MLNTYLLIFISSLAPLAGAYYARKTNRADLLVAIYVVFLALSQIFAVKIAKFDLGFISVYTTGASLIFAVTFLITDIVNEKFGRKETVKMIFFAFFTQVLMVAFIYLVSALAPAPFWPDQDAWMKIFGFVPRIVGASLITFLISENFDAFVFSWFKKITHGKFLWMRNAFSSIPALTLDTLLFVVLAFAGSGIPLWPLMFGQFMAKWTVGVIDIPFMYLNRRVLGKPT
ncbi:queuosine precursor transporter, partial [Patescibacteria group bacterium]|nr:queuosine precursor transporter [Patescibacteria group bacterium]